MSLNQEIGPSNPEKVAKGGDTCSYQGRDL